MKKLERAIAKTKKEIISYQDSWDTPSTHMSTCTDPFDAMIEEKDVRQNVRCIPGARELRLKNSLKLNYR